MSDEVTTKTGGGNKARTAEKPRVETASVTALLAVDGKAPTTGPAQQQKPPQPQATGKPQAPTVSPQDKENAKRAAELEALKKQCATLLARLDETALKPPADATGTQAKIIEEKRTVIRNMLSASEPAKDAPKNAGALIGQLVTAIETVKQEIIFAAKRAALLADCAEAKLPTPVGCSDPGKAAIAQQRQAVESALPDPSAQGDIDKATVALNTLREIIDLAGKRAQAVRDTSQARPSPNALAADKSANEQQRQKLLDSLPDPASPTDIAAASNAIAKLKEAVDAVQKKMKDATAEITKFGLTANGAEIKSNAPVNVGVGQVIAFVPIVQTKDVNDRLKAVPIITWSDKPDLTAQLQEISDDGRGMRKVSLTGTGTVKCNAFISGTNKSVIGNFNVIDQSAINLTAAADEKRVMAYAKALKIFDDQAFQKWLREWNASRAAKTVATVRQELTTLRDGIGILTHREWLKIAGFTEGSASCWMIGGGTLAVDTTHSFDIHVSVFPTDGKKPCGATAANLCSRILPETPGLRGLHASMIIEKPDEQLKVFANTGDDWTPRKESIAYWKSMGLPTVNAMKNLIRNWLTANKIVATNALTKAYDQEREHDNDYI